MVRHIHAPMDDDEFAKAERWKERVSEIATGSKTELSWTEVIQLYANDQSLLPKRRGP